MIPIVFAGLVAGPITAAALWGYGALEAVLAAPIGGSLAAICVATFIGLQRREPAARHQHRAFWTRAHFASEWHASAHG